MPAWLPLSSTLTKVERGASTPSLRMAASTNHSHSQPRVCGCWIEKTRMPMNSSSSEMRKDHLSVITWSSQSPLMRTSAGIERPSYSMVPGTVSLSSWMIIPRSSAELTTRWSTCPDSVGRFRTRVSSPLSAGSLGSCAWRM